MQMLDGRLHTVINTNDIKGNHVHTNAKHDSGKTTLHLRMLRCSACMTRTPPENRRRLTGGALRPRKGILRHALQRSKTLDTKALCQEVWPTLSKSNTPSPCMRTPTTRSKRQVGIQSWMSATMLTTYILCTWIMTWAPRLEAEANREP